ncbi:MAG TPA: acylneuraminate cytidylyltransferase family protein [Kofleriaceae bacterium]
MNVLGLITARGGSKGIPRKNLAPCGGEPLLYWTCKAARDARCLSRTVISTDDAEIAEYARSQGVEVPFMRPAELSSDTATSIGVAQHAITSLGEDGWATDIVVLLQPTSPLRTGVHLDEAFAQLRDGLDAVVSIIPVPHRFAPWNVMRLEGDLLRDYDTSEQPFERTRRQGQPVLYARNGPVVIVTRAPVIMRASFYGERCAPYHMTPRDSVDIDDADDLAWADFLLRRRGGG